MDKVKACPFCGQKPEIDNPDFAYPVTRPDAEGKQVHRVGCIESAGGCGAEVTGWSHKEALTTWNTRICSTNA